jgi:Calcineurin-like phosphoesterase
MQKSILSILILVLGWTFPWAQTPEVQFVFTSDSHYGLHVSTFRGVPNVDAHVVNAALVEGMNRLGTAAFPADGGLRSGAAVGPVDFVVDGGDIANRAEVVGSSPIQSAAKSWAQFRADYLDGLRLLDRTGGRAPLYVIPGNHDASNAAGFYKAMIPAIDKTSMLEIYNLMMNPAKPKTPATYDYAKDRMRVSHDIGGVHFIFLTLWPDTATREWMESDLRQVSAGTPVIIFAHDQPDSQSKQFINPNGRHDINERDMFENLLGDTLEDGVAGARTIDVPPLAEQAALEAFLRRHPNISAYFHGNSNWNQFYDWTGPNHTVALHTFRVDSPIKGSVSATDEARLSFQIATIDTVSRTMTVREVLWNAHPRDPNVAIAWGASTTVALFPRPSP